jgi:site-specific DNA-methyltransferase (adenine-specific)
LNVIANIEGLEVGAIAPNSIVNADCLEAMQLISDNSIDLILTDPPYFKVKKEQWDRQWDTAKGFLTWLDLIAEQWQRILKPNGSLYCFASPKMAARVEVMLGERFNIVNRITWQKPPFATKAEMFVKEDLRGFFPASESIIFCEHYGADNIAKGEAGYGAKCDELRGFVFAPLADYLKAERDKAGWQNEDAKIACGHSPTSGCHWFDRSQWTLPTEKVYSSWQSKTDYFRREYEDLRREYEDLRREYEDLRREYEDLRREYEDLRREYEDLRRPFSVTAEVSYTDVWTYPTISYYDGKHPCEKPIAMLEHIITASSREGALVLDSFAGSANTAKSAINTNRQYICIEKDPHYFEVMRDRVANHDPNAPVKTKKPKAVPKGQLALF